MEINKHSSTPLYAQVRELILKRIREGDYKPGSRIPSEMKLCNSLGLSRPTVRQAIQGLVDSGYLVIKKGRGTFVVEEPSPTVLQNFNPRKYSFLCNDDPESYEKRAYQSRIIESSDYLDSVFNFAKDLYHPGYWNLSYPAYDLDGILVGYCNIYVPVRFFDKLGQQIENKAPIAEIMSNKYQYIPRSANVYVSNRPCSKMEASVLDVPERTNVMNVESKMVTKGQYVTEFISLVLLSDQVCLEFNDISVDRDKIPTPSTQAN